MKQRRLLLLAGLIHGLIFVFLVPPWQHYDEPTQFEFAWLLANQPGLPEEGEYNQQMRLELAASMIEHGFFDDLSFHPNLVSQSEPIWIGVSQTGDRPIYYFLVSLLLRLVPTSDLHLQLLLGRLVSLSLFLTTILAAYGLTTELTASDHPLRWMVPLTVALLPGLTDNMTAINNDAAATAFFSLFLWVGVRMIKRGFSWIHLVALLTTAALSLFSKNTTVVVLLLALMIVLFFLFPRNRRKYAWISLVALILIGPVFLMSWGNAAHWFSILFVDTPSRTREPHAPIGRYVFRLEFETGIFPSRLTQIVPASAISNLEQYEITLGAWIWADRPTRVRTPTLQVGQQAFFQEVDANTEPKFYAFQADLPERPNRIEITLAPFGTGEVKENVTVYYDGVVLTPGNFSPGTPPQYSTSDGRAGTWDSRPFENLLINPSAEHGWPRLHTWADQFISDYTPMNASIALASLLDWSSSGSYYSATFIHLFQSFWARFGWGHVVLSGFHPYTILGIISLAGLVGFGLLVLRQFKSGNAGTRRKIPWEILVIFGVALGWVWGAALVRGINSILSNNTFIPSARYAYPVILPTILVFCLGWLEIIQLANVKSKLSMPVLYGGYVLFLLALDALSILSIARYYY